MTEEIRSLADLRPGDIGVTTMSGLFPGWFPVRIGSWLCKESMTEGEFSADHVLICVEAAGPGRPARDVPFGELLPGADMDTYRSLPRAVQAMPHGAEEIALTPAKHWGPRVRWFRLPEDYPGQAQDAAAIARLFVSEKVPYSFASYAALALWSRGLKAERLERWINRRRPSILERLPSGKGFQIDGDRITLSSVPLPREAICSVLVDQCWSLAGKRVIEGVKRQCVTPGMMAIQLENRAGVIHGVRG